jgi:hypothetical protein
LDLFKTQLTWFDKFSSEQYRLNENIILLDLWNFCSKLLQGYSFQELTLESQVLFHEFFESPPASLCGFPELGYVKFNRVNI